MPLLMSWHQTGHPIARGEVAGEAHLQPLERGKPGYMAATMATATRAKPAGEPLEAAAGDAVWLA